MSAPKHTPGPWLTFRSANPPKLMRDAIITAKGKTLAWLMAPSIVGLTENEADGNGNVMALAPEMLALIERTRDALEPLTSPPPNELPEAQAFERDRIVWDELLAIQADARHIITAAKGEKP